MTCGCVQVAPPSVDLTNASCALLRAPRNGVLGGTIRSVKSYSVSSRGSTMTMLPIVCWRLPVLMVIWGWLQGLPPAGGLGEYAGPVYARGWGVSSGWSAARSHG